MVSLSLAVDEALGLPQRLRVTGVELDAARRQVGPIAYDGHAAAVGDFLRLAGIVGSAQERFQFEEAFGVPAISADLGLGIAREQGIEVLAVDAANVDLLVGELEHPEPVVAAVAAWARAGLRVEVPRSEVTHRQWQGSIWHVVDPTTGGSGYFLSGGLGALGGGATAVPFELWPIGFLADAFEAYGQETNPDPGAAASITRLEHTDGQRGTVGELLGDELAVAVHDEVGRPVLGAEVELFVERGGGSLIGEDGSEGVVVVVRTDERGIASAALRLGTDTSIDPELLWDESDSPRPTRASAHQIEARVEGVSGTFFLDRPLIAHALPAAPETFRRVDSAAQSFRVEPARWVDTVVLEVADRFGNPVSNVPVRATMEVGDLVAGFEECVSDFDPEPAPGALFAFADCGLGSRLLGSCGDDELVVESGPGGATFGVITGASLLYEDRLRVEVTALSAQASFEYGRPWVVLEDPESPSTNSACDALLDDALDLDLPARMVRVVPNRLRVLTSVPSDPQGRSLLRCSARRGGGGSDSGPAPGVRAALGGRGGCEPGRRGGLPLPVPWRR